MQITRMVSEGLVAHLASLPVSRVSLARVVGAHPSTIAAPTDALVAMGGRALVGRFAVDAIKLLGEESAWLSDTIKVISRVEDANIMLCVLTLVVWTINAVLLEDDDAVHARPFVVVVSLDDRNVLLDGVRR